MLGRYVPNQDTPPSPSGRSRQTQEERVARADARTRPGPRAPPSTWWIVSTWEHVGSQVPMALESLPCSKGQGQYVILGHSHGSNDQNQEACHHLSVTVDDSAFGSHPKF